MDYKQTTEIYLEKDDVKYARIVIEEKDGVYDIVHTYVSDEHRGEGLAGKLMEKALEFIAQQKGNIAASCSYAAHYLDKHEIEYMRSENGSACSLKHMNEDVK